MEKRPDEDMYRRERYFLFGMIVLAFFLVMAVVVMLNIAGVM